MRFLADMGVDVRVVQWLRQHGTMRSTSGMKDCMLRDCFESCSRSASLGRYRHRLSGGARKSASAVLMTTGSAPAIRSTSSMRWSKLVVTIIRICPIVANAAIAVWASVRSSRHASVPLP